MIAVISRNRSTSNVRLMCPLRCTNGGAGILACLCRTFLSGRIGSRSTACRGRQECLPHRAPPKGHEPNVQLPTSNLVRGFWPTFLPDYRGEGARDIVCWLQHLELFPTRSGRHSLWAALAVRN